MVVEGFLLCNILDVTRRLDTHLFVILSYEGVRSRPINFVELRRAVWGIV